MHGDRSLDIYCRSKGCYIILSNVEKDSCKLSRAADGLTSACVNISNAAGEFVSVRSETKFMVFSCLTATRTDVRDGRLGESSTRVGEWTSFRLRQLCPRC